MHGKLTALVGQTASLAPAFLHQIADTNLAMAAQQQDVDTFIAGSAFRELSATPLKKEEEN